MTKRKKNAMTPSQAGRKASLSSPWRKQHFCKTQKALESRSRLDADPKDNA